MALIETLSILGIRSFGPEDKHQQVIKFQHPLTLIVGPNGAGKTTVIECLRYSTTGEHPLNTKGGAFVHDPKIASVTEVKAKVQLKCKNNRGNDVVVSRSMTATSNKKSGMKFKTLDGSIKKTINGENVSISSKCADLNKEMVLTLGVSKAVLDNVIFCHQEESNWPLSEGKAVKQRFDEIFAATRYIKALEEIRKIQRDHKSKKDIEEQALKHLNANNVRAKDIKNRLAMAEANFSKVKKSKAETEEKLGPIGERLAELSQKRAQVIKLDGELGARKSRKDQMVKDKEKLESRINNLFHGTDEQLYSLQEDQEKVLSSKRQRQVQCRNRIRPLQDEINRLTSVKTNLSIEQGKLQQEVKNASERRLQQSELIRKTVEETGISVTFSFIGDLSSNDIEEFEEKYNAFKSNEMKRMKNKKTELDRQLQLAENEYQSCWRAKMELEEASKHKAKALSDTKQKLNETNRELKRIQTSGDKSKLEDMELIIAGAQQELEDAEAATNFGAYRSELRDLAIKKTQLDDEMATVDSEIMESQKSAQIQTKLELLEKDKKAKEWTLSQLQSKNQEPLTQLGLFARSNFPNRSQLISWIQEKEDDLEQTQREFKQKKASLDKKTAELEMTSKQIKQKRTRSSELDETLFEVCGSQDIDQDLTTLETDIKRLQGKKGVTDGIQHMYRKFIADMTRTDIDKKEVTCPLCQRLFDETSEVDDLISQLEEKLEVAPKKLENQAKELVKKQDRYKLLQENKPLKLELDRLNETEIPELEKSSKTLQSAVRELKHQADQLENQYSQLRKDEITARNCVADVARMDTLQVEIRNRSKELSGLRNQLPAGAVKKSIDELQETKKNVASKLSKMNKAIEDKKAEIQQKTDLINDLKNRVIKAQQEKFQLAEDLQKTEQLKEKRKSLAAEIEKLQMEIDDNSVQLAPLSSRVEEAARHKAKLSRHRDETANEINKKKQELEAKFKQIETINQEIQRFDETGVDHKLKRTASRIVELERKIEQTNDTLQQSHEDVNKLEKELATCTDRQRDLEDNIALRERNKEIGEVEREVREMEEELQGMNVAKLERESRQLSEQNHKLKEERVSFGEKEVRYREEADSLKEQLNQPEHRNAEQDYRESLVKCSILELASKDLEKYYKALDRAIMKYHQIKMEEINKIIKALWQETYCGSDIEKIQICSDEDTGSTTTRRVFNYRVVMYCSGVPMDMRGRCSAGQKVLASLVIRLALAETFCINCGILALDEPTTNLDRDNIESLAKSLVSIIESRSRQRNFQLVIITHDEDFVDLLGRSKYVDHFFRVIKDEQSHSRIYRCPIQEIAS